ncbi:Sulfotransferase family cytosolic 1B member 1 [Nymphon striatum]|nr:Sulfotransferase family cytosolic 1B member 1 [Nymphon striatum]
MISYGSKKSCNILLNIILIFLKMTTEWKEVHPNNQFKAVPKWYKASNCGTLMPSNMLADPYSLYEDFVARPDDVYVLSFPKCGASWLQEIVWLIKNNADTIKAKESRSDERIPFVELPPFRLKTSFFDDIQSPRILKTHLNYSLLPHELIEKKCKLIYQARNPKDVCVSYFHFAHMNNHFDYAGDFETFFQLFIEDRLPFSPFWTSVKEYWNKRNDENMLFLMYEDFHLNFMKTAKQVASFLGVTLTDEQFSKIKDHCSFKQMKTSPTTNYQYWDDLGFRKKEGTQFMRKGIAGDWKNKFTVAMNERMDEWIDENTRGTGIKFTYQV